VSTVEPDEGSQGGNRVAENLQWKIGDVVVTRVVESVTNIPPAALLPSSSDATIEAHASWLRPHFVDDDGNFILSIHAFGITTGERKIIVDTCIGNDRRIPGMEALNLQTPFLSDLAEAGFPREEVDTVICTHLHFDHVGWNTMLVDGEWVPTFPNARYLLCRTEWEHWREEGGSGYTATIDDAVRPVIDAGLADLVPSDHEVTGEIRLEATPGHTPGHVAVHVESGGQHALITGDSRTTRCSSPSPTGTPTPTPTASSRPPPAAGCWPSMAARTCS
jgi:glyoxylase-like metal-dependent hydrolase (beta-lactamase superfamily II)